MPLSETSQKHKHPILFRGAGTLSRLNDILPKYKNILVFTGKHSFNHSGVADFFKQIGERLQGNTIIRYFPYGGKALPLEEVETVYNDVQFFPGADLIVAVGGGTVIDLAKLISIAYSNQCLQVAEILDHRDMQNTVDLVFIPTTPGTGSEATSFAVVYREKVKLSIDNSSVLPDFVLLDPLLLKSLPREVLNAVVLDALAQAVESVWARGATEESRKYAGLAIRNILQHYQGEPTVQRLDGLLWASHLAGKAIHISRTTLSHSISYPITAHFGVSHGIAVFLTLPDVALFNYQADAHTLQPGLDMTHIERSFSILFDVFEVKTIEQLAAKLRDVMGWFKFSLRLRDYGIDHQALPFLADNGLTQGRSDNNPRKIDNQALLKMLEGIF